MIRTNECPSCGGKNKAGSTECRYCGSFFQFERRRTPAWTPKTLQPVPHTPNAVLRDKSSNNIYNLPGPYYGVGKAPHGNAIVENRSGAAIVCFFIVLAAIITLALVGANP